MRYGDYLNKSTPCPIHRGKCCCDARNWDSEDGTWGDSMRVTQQSRNLNPDWPHLGDALWSQDPRQRDQLPRARAFSPTRQKTHPRWAAACQGPCSYGGEQSTSTACLELGWLAKAKEGARTAELHASVLDIADQKK